MSPVAGGGLLFLVDDDASQSVVGVSALGYGSRLFGGELVVSWFNNRPPLVCLPWQIVIFCFL